MSNDTENHLPIQEMTEGELNYKEIITTTESSQSSQSQVIVEGNNIDLMQTDTSTIGRNEDIYSIVDKDTFTIEDTRIGEVDNQECVLNTDSKETQTEITENDDVYQIQKDTESEAHKVREIEDDKARDIGEDKVREIEEDKVRDIGEDKVRDIGEDKVRDIEEGKVREIGKDKVRDIGEDKVRDIEEDKVRDIEEDKVREIGKDKVRELEEDNVGKIEDSNLSTDCNVPLDNKTEDLGKARNKENSPANNYITEKTAEITTIDNEGSKELNTTEFTNNVSTMEIKSLEFTSKCQIDIHQENITEPSTSVKEDDAKISRERSSSENIELAVIKDEKNPINMPTEPVIKQSEILEKSPKSEISSEEIEISSRNGLHSAEIKEEYLKCQLKEIIKEIDIEVDKEEGEYIHTWHPKGEYKIEKTHIQYPEIVPVKVPDIVEKEAKVEKALPQTPKQKPPPAKPKMVERKPSEDSNCSTPIEIPEGVPLLARMLPKEGEQDGGRDKIPLERLFTPASDSEELILTKKKLFSSSSFYRPDHPTIEDQVHLAHKISVSLIDDINKESKGQSMYMKRKTKSTKWAHTGQEAGFLEGQWQANESDLLPPKESKEPPRLKLLLNPKGIHDYNSIQDEEYEERTITPNHIQYQLTGIGVGKEIVTDLQSPTGKGAALFAKRKKRMDKFIIDETNVQKALVNKQEIITAVTEQNSYSSSNAYNGPTPISNPTSYPGSRNLPNLSNILTQPKPAPTKKSILTTPKGKTIKRSNTVSFPSLDRGFPHRTPTPSMREKRGQIKSWGSQNSTGTSLDFVAGNRPQAQKRFSHIEISSSNNSLSTYRRPLDYGKRQKINTVYTAEVKVEEKAAMSPPINFELNGLDPSHYLDIAMTNQEKRKSFNVAAKGWGTYNHFYTPLHLGTTS